MTKHRVETATVQDRGRISFPNDMLRDKGLDIGEKVLLVEGDDEIVLKAASAENIK